MEDDFLTDEEYRRDFDLEPLQGRALWRDVFGCLGYVFSKGDSGSGANELDIGSGVFVRTLAGRVALLTCKHVVEPGIERNAVWVGGYNYDAPIPGSTRMRRVAWCKAATEFLVSTTCDAALVYAPEGLVVRDLLEASDWDPRTRIDRSSSDRIIAAGQPADPDWLVAPRVAERIIDEMKTLLMWSTATRVFPHEGLIELLALRTRGLMPASYAVMSGGPLFSTRGQLLGILTGETPLDSPGGIRALQRSQWRDIYLPHSAAEA